MLVAGCLSAALAQSVYRVPIQVSDSLEAIVISARAPSSRELFTQTLHFSDATLRPMRYIQARWLLQAADAAGWSYTATFRGLHASLIAVLVLVFVWALRIESWLDFAAAAVPLTIVAGLHTSVGMMREAYPVNHFAEIALCALLVLALGRSRHRVWSGAAAVGMLAFCLLLLESGVLVWLVIAACAAARLPGISRRAAVTATLVVACYVTGRFALGIQPPAIGSHGSGYGATFYSASELKDRFGPRSGRFLAYNVVGGLASLLLSEPRYGIYETLAVSRGAPLHPVLPINLLSSLLVTALLAWYFVRLPWLIPRRWTEEHRVMVIALTVMVVNAMMTSTYIKDEILSVAGVFYAVAAYIAIRALLHAAQQAPPRLLATVLLAVLMATTSTLWAFRLVGAHFQLRETAFTTRNDWADVLSPGHPADWPIDQRELSLIRRLKEEALIHRVANPADLPRWGERYWVE